MVNRPLSTLSYSRVNASLILVISAAPFLLILALTSSIINAFCLLLETERSTASVILSQRLSAASVLLEMLESCGQLAQLLSNKSTTSSQTPIDHLFSENYTPSLLYSSPSLCDCYTTESIIYHQTSATPSSCVGQRMRSSGDRCWCCHNYAAMTGTRQARWYRTYLCRDRHPKFQ